MRNQLRKWVFGMLLVAGVCLAPAAFARSHVSVGLGINLPGVSIGVSNWGHGYGWAGSYYPAYYGSYYAPAYYAPTYYSYAAPVYYGPRYYGGGYYYRGAPVVHRTYYRSDYGHRGRYYDRGGYYRR